MKKKVLLLAVVMLVGFGKTWAQMDDCAITLSLFVEPAKAKNYDAALPHYDKVVAECPKYSLATYQYGEKMFKHFIEKGDKAKIDNYIENFNLRMQYYPSRTKQGDVMAKIAQLKYDNGMGSKMDQFNAFDEAYKKDAANFKSPKSMYTYFSLAVDLFNEGQKDIQEVFDLYDVVINRIESEESSLAKNVTTLSEKEESGTALSSKEKKRLKASETNLNAYGKVKGSVNGKLGKIADCENLIPLYEKEFQNKKDNINWLRSAAGRLNAKDCETPLFFELVQQLHTLEPSAKSAFYLGRLADRNGDASTALEYYNQAAELETNPSDKAKVYYSIAENMRKKGSYGQARSYYNKALAEKPSMGVCYLKIAQMYAKSSNSCGNNVFEKRAVNWLAAQEADKAARVDASIAGNARAAASSYRQRAPSKTDIFSESMAGKTVTFSCWIGRSVKVPNL